MRLTKKKNHDGHSKKVTTGGVPSLSWGDQGASWVGVITTKKRITKKKREEKVRDQNQSSFQKKGSKDQPVKRGELDGV